MARTTRSGPACSRRRLLATLLLVPAALAGCSVVDALGRGDQPSPDPLLPLADAARADAALATAAASRDPELGRQLQPLIAARTEHAAALDAEIARLDPDRPTPTPAPPPAGTNPDRAAVSRAVLAAGRTASQVAVGLPAERVGLVASVAACCRAYAEVLG